MAEVPRPAYVQPPAYLSAEEPSGSHQIATMADVKEFKTRAVGEAHKQILSSDVKWFAGSMVGAIAVALVAVFWVQSTSSAQAQEKSAVVQKDLDEHKKADATEKAEINEKLNRQDKKLDAVLFHFAIPNPAPTPPAPKKDGGK